MHHAHRMTISCPEQTPFFIRTLSGYLSTIFSVSTGMTDVRLYGQVDHLTQSNGLPCSWNHYNSTLIVPIKEQPTFTFSSEVCAWLWLGDSR